MVQNSLTRIVSRTVHHSSRDLQQLHWMLVTSRINYKICPFKVIHNLDPWGVHCLSAVRSRAFSAAPLPNSGTHFRHLQQLGLNPDSKTFSSKSPFRTERISFSLSFINHHYYYYYIFLCVFLNLLFTAVVPIPTVSVSCVIHGGFVNGPQVQLS